MCPPMAAAAPFALAAATTGLSGASSILSFLGQQQQYQQQQAIANNQTITYNRNVTLAKGANRQEKEQLNRRAIQERDALTEQNRIGAIKQAQGRATVGAKAGESGVSGVSVDNVLADIERGGASDQAQREATYMNTVAQLRGEMDSADTRYTQRVNSMQPGVNTAAPPSVAGLLLGVGSAGLNGAATYVKYDDLLNRSKAKAPA